MRYSSAVKYSGAVGVQRCSGVAMHVYSYMYCVRVDVREC